MNNVIFADAHEHAIKTVPEMILVYNKQATLLNIVNPSGNLPFNPEGMVGTQSCVKICGTVMQSFYCI